MQIKELVYADVRQRTRELGCEIPTGLALLPVNFETATSKDDLVHAESASTIRVLWRQAGIQETKIEPAKQRFDELHQKSLEWIGPTIFVSASLLSQDANTVSIALSVIANYLTDFFKGIPGIKNTKLDIVTEQEDGEQYRYQCYRYEGPVDGLLQLERIIRASKHD